MKTILVDDMILDLQLFEMKCADMPEFEIVGKFTDPNEAIEYASGHVVDFALLDVDMPGMTGIELAQKLREQRRDIIIMFATAHPKFAFDALKMKADYVVFKPFDKEDIADMMERAKLLQARQKKRYCFQTFGNFEMMVDNQIVRFQSNRAKELMALCVYEEGRSVSIHRMLECIWGEEATAYPAKTGYRRIIKELADSLRAYGAEDLLIREYGSIRIRTELCDSDYQSFMDGEPNAICSFRGAYMKQYSWAEDKVYTLQERKELFMRHLR